MAHESIAMTRPVVILLILAAVAPAQEPPADGFLLPPGAVRRFGNRQLRHPEGISALAISPDGKLLATASSKNVVVWDAKTLAARRVFRLSVRYNSQTDRGGTIAFLPDSKSILVSVHPEGGIPGGAIDLAQVWDIETGKKKFGLTGPHDYFAAVWAIAGGKELAVLSNHAPGGQSGIKVWDARDGNLLRTVPIPENVNPPWVGPTGRLVATHGHGRSRGGVVDVRTGSEVFPFPQVPSQVALARDDNLVVWVDQPGIVHVHDLAARKEKFVFPHPARANPGPMVVSADGKTLYLSGTEGRLFRWDLVNNKKGPDFAGRHSSWSLTALALSPDETVLYSAANDHLVKRWDTKTGKELPLPEGYTTHISQVIAADGKHLILTDHDGRVDYWDLAAGRRVRQIPKSHVGEINHLDESADGRWLAAGRTGQDVRLFDRSNGKAVWDTPVGDSQAKWEDPVRRVGFRPDGTVVYGVSQGTGLTAWEVPDGKKLWTVPNTGHLLAVDPKGRWLATGKSFGVHPPIQWDLRDARTGAAVAAIEVEQVDVPDPSGKVFRQFPFLLDLAWSPDGSWVVSAHYDGSVRLWDPDRRKEVRRLPVGRYAVAPRCLGVSPDGKWVAVGGPERGVSVWELATGTKLLSLAGHDSYVSQVAFTRDGRGLVSNADLSPILWDLCPKDLPTDNLWDALAAADGAKAYRAQWALVKNPATAVQLFSEKVKPAELAVSRKQLDQWVADLDSPQFPVREAAERALTTSGGKVAVAWLRKALADAKGEEPRTRLTRIVAAREKGPDPEGWRLARAVQVLELTGTPEARALLKTWAGVESPHADDARGALERLSKQR